MPLKQKGESIPFDITTIRTLDYDLSDLDAVENIKKRLSQTIQSFDFTSNVVVEDEIQNHQDGIGNVLQVLYQLQDSILGLRDEIRSKDANTIQAIMETSLNNAKNSDASEMSILKVLLPELMKNPESFKNLIQISEMVKKDK